MTISVSNSNCGLKYHSEKQRDLKKEKSKELCVSV